MNSVDMIVHAFAFLEANLSYRQVRSEFDARNFGNAIIEFWSPQLLVRVTKDRGQYFCDFANPRQGEWFELENVFRDLGEDQVLGDLIAQRWSSLDAVADSVRLTIKRISSLFEDEFYPESRARLLNRGRQRLS